MEECNKMNDELETMRDQRAILLITVDEAGTLLSSVGETSYFRIFRREIKEVADIWYIVFTQNTLNNINCFKLQSENMCHFYRHSIRHIQLLSSCVQRFKFAPEARLQAFSSFYLCRYN